jgi:signal transduction histidine kinase/DNA-binding response OmpR family regulator
MRQIRQLAGAPVFPAYPVIFAPGTGHAGKCHSDPIELQPNINSRHIRGVGGGDGKERAGGQRDLSFHHPCRCQRAKDGGLHLHCLSRDSRRAHPVRGNPAAGPLGLHADLPVRRHHLRRDRRLAAIHQALSAAELGVASSVWFICAAALAVLWWRRPHSLLDIWLIVVLSAWFTDLGLSAVLNHGRFDLGFYAGRAFGLVAAIVLLVVLLVENDTLYSRLAESYARERSDREQRLREVQEARAAADAANRAKSDFLANMSHEIRTPLHAIIGYTHLLQQAAISPAEQDKLRRISVASGHLLSIINNILDFSKIESGKIALENIDFEFERLVVDRVVAMIQESAREKGIEIVTDIDPALVRTLRGDPTRLGQLMLNYADNAVKFTETGAVVLRARVTREDESDITLRFEARDTGIGLSAAELSHLFQSFQQADSSTTRRYGGTGLGLVINRNLALMMGGEVGAESEPGRGSTFWFTVHVAKSAARPDPQVSRDVAGRRILLADDRAEAREAVCNMAAGLGARAQAVPDGEAALAAVSAADAAGEPFDLVLVDSDMPGPGGSETAHRLGMLALRRPPALILLTPQDTGAARWEAGRPGIAGEIAKPVTPSALRETLAQALERRTDLPRRAGRVSPVQPLAGGAHAGKRVLLAEDHRLNRELLVELLRGAELEIDAAAGGLEAVAMASATAYDLILMDMQMPDMDGIDATRAIRRLPGYGDVPIIAMTGAAFEDDRAACLAAGMSDYLAKPIAPAVLLATLSRWLSTSATFEAT